jgi:hypothetical protein
MQPAATERNTQATKLRKNIKKLLTAQPRLTNMQAFRKRKMLLQSAGVLYTTGDSKGK